jgi:hypothetical protein
MRAFEEEARAQSLGRLGKVELVAVEPALLAWLAGAEQRRAKLSVTVVSDHLYLERGGETADCPITRANLSY